MNLIKVWPDFANLVGFSRAAAYAAVHDLPRGMVLKIGGRVRIDLDKLKPWLDSGGCFPEKQTRAKKGTGRSLDGRHAKFDLIDADPGDLEALGSIAGIKL